MKKWYNVICLFIGLFIFIFFGVKGYDRITNGLSSIAQDIKPISFPKDIIEPDTLLLIKDSIYIKYIMINGDIVERKIFIYQEIDIWDREYIYPDEYKIRYIIKNEIKNGIELNYEYYPPHSIIKVKWEKYNK